MAGQVLCVKLFLVITIDLNMEIRIMLVMELFHD